MPLPPLSSPSLVRQTERISSSDIVYFTVLCQPASKIGVDEFRDKLKYVLIHSVRADNALSDLSASTKTSSDWQFLTMLRDRGRALAGEWLDQNFTHLGVRSTVDLKKEFL